VTRRLWADQGGVSAVEFAICLPFIVLLYLGGYQLSDSISAYRKVTAATRTVADLTSQSTSVTA
jgi:Flp pilus assembly protein TadG